MGQLLECIMVTSKCTCCLSETDGGQPDIQNGNELELLETGVDQKLINNATNPLNFIVGGPNCSFRTVVQALDPAETLDLQTRYSDIAHALGIPTGQILRLRRHVDVDTKTFIDIYYETLETWHLRADANEATLGNLIQVLEDNRMKAAADRLRVAFGIPIQGIRSKLRKLNWKWKLLLGIISLGSLAILGVAAWLYVKPPDEPKYKNTLPQKPPFYIPRTLVPRSYVSNKIFRFTNGNIFVISDIDKRQFLKSCLKGNYGDYGKCIRADAIDEQLNKEIDVSFMMLNQNNDFDKLCAKINDSVHLLEYRKEHDLFKWIRSRGDLEVLQNNLEDDTHIIHSHHNETSLINKLDNNIIVYGAPGIGKTTLLAEIGEILQSTEHHVTFFSLNQLVNQLKKLDNGTTDDKQLRNTFSTILAKQACENRICEKLLKSKLLTKNTTMVILLDGYDQVEADDLPFVDKYLRSIQTVNLTLIVTTRPHLLTRLENVLQTLGHNLLPFSDTDQIKFLQTNWASSAPNLDMERLFQFSASCLKTLNSKIADKERSVTGVALLCLVIAQVYENDAISYSHLENIKDKNLPPKIKVVTSIWDLFDKLIDIKFKVYNEISEEDKKAILYEHAFQAICLLFPNYNRSSELFAKLKVVDTADILKLGILEQINNNNKGDVVFYHQTFADYFVAWFIVENLQKGETSTSFQQFFIDEAMATLETSVSVDIHWNKTFIHTHKFKNKIGTQFLDSGVRSLKHDSLNFISNNCDSECQSKKLYACAYSNLISLFQVISTIFGSIAVKTSESLISLVVLHSSVSFLSIVSNQLQKSTPSQFPAPLMLNSVFPSDINNLDLALRRGSFYVFQYLWASGYYKTETRCVLHACICGSKHDSEETISDKKQIIRFLVEFYNWSILEEKHFFRCPFTPLLCPSAHHELILELLEHNADHLEVNLMQETVLHISAATHSPKDFHSVLEKIDEKGQSSISKLIKSKDDRGRTPLHVIVSNFEPLEDTLQKISMAGANFNSMDNNGASVVASVINSHHHSAHLLERLYYFGAVVDHTLSLLPERLNPPECPSCPHPPILCPSCPPPPISCPSCPPPPPPYLYPSCPPPNSCPSCPPPNSCPLCPPSPPQFCSSSSCQAPDIKQQTGTPLHLSVKWGDLESVRFLLSAGLNPNALSYPDDETPLEIKAMQDWRGSHVLIAKELIKSGADVDQVIEAIKENRGNWWYTSPSHEMIMVLKGDSSSNSMEIRSTIKDNQAGHI